MSKRKSKGTSDLSHISTDEIRQEIARRDRARAALERRRENALATVAEIEAELSGGGPVPQRHRRKAGPRRQGRTDTPALVEFLAHYKGATATTAELVGAAQAVGIPCTPQGVGQVMRSAPAWRRKAPGEWARRRSRANGKAEG